jgi:hypothetical protein
LYSKTQRVWVKTKERIKWNPKETNVVRITIHFTLKKYQLIEQINFKTKEECIKSLGINFAER